MHLPFLRRASHVYHLRQHRAESVLVSDAELVEVRAPSPSHPSPARPSRPLHRRHGSPHLPQSLPPQVYPQGKKLHRRHPSNSPPLSPSLSPPYEASRASPPPVTDAQLTEIRASQRTFEGAYIRTALGQFSFALVVLKIFTAEFYSIGALFAAYGAGVLLVSLYRRHQGNRQFFDIVGEDGLQRKRFRTSGNVVVGLTALSVCAYAALLALVVRLL